MHERALVSRTALELTATAGSAGLSSVTLALSPETSVRVVEEAWHAATAGTRIATAALSCVTREHGLQCLDCGAGYRGDKLTRCPCCGGNGLIVERAPEVALDAWVAREPG